MLRVLTSLAIFSFMLVACGTEKEEAGEPLALVTCSSVVDKIVACQLPDWSVEDAREFCEAVVLSQPCLESMYAASCSDHAADESSYDNLCAPRCETDTLTQCSGDNMTMCIEDSEGSATGRRVTFRCQAICARQNKTYVGECSNSYVGLELDDGSEICFCD